MIDTRAVMSSLPLVASILGRKYGVQVEMGGTDAYTDGSVIHLPALPADASDTLLPLVRGYLDHEAGHIRETDFQALKVTCLSPIEMHVWNTLEDWRVEHKLASVFPGCRQNFDWLIGHIFGSDQHQSSELPAAVILDWLLLSVRSWDMPKLWKQRDDLARQMDTLFPGIRARLEQILSLARISCGTTQDAIDFAREIVRELNQFVSHSHEDLRRKSEQADESGRKNNENQTQKERSQEEVEDVKDVNDDALDQDGDKNGNSESTDETMQTQEDEPTSHQNSQKIIDQMARSVQDLIEAREEDLPQNLGKFLAEALYNCANASDTMSVAVATSQPKQQYPLAQSYIDASRQATTALRTKLGGLLQTTVLSRSSSGRRGMLDTTRLHRFAACDPRVFRTKAERAGIDTAVHILLDCSGSMVNMMRLACSACYALSSALYTSKINVAVTAFPGNQSSTDSYATVSPIIRHGQHIHTNLDLIPSGSTPLGEALWWVMQDMLPVRERRKIILIVTDGMPDSFECARHAMAQGRRAGFEIYGLGIACQYVTELMPGKSKVVDSIPELPDAMFSLLEAAVFHGK